MRYVVLISFALWLVSCSTPSLDPVEYAHWIEDESNGLKVSKELDDFEFELQYRPIEYVSVIESRGEPITDQALKVYQTDRSGLQYYNLKITSKVSAEMLKTGIYSEEEYRSRLYYFTGPAQYDISLVQGQDTLPCLLFHFERNYGIAPYNNIVLAFENSITNEDRQFLFFDQVLGVGTVKLTIARESIDGIPALKTSNT